MDKIITQFSITPFGNLQKFDETKSKGRCRIFYKGANRNRSFITDEFAEQLISTLPYTPVKGIYDTNEEDYTDHGSSRSLGRIYGVVPEDCNFAWEKHFDDDGVEREYACVDVLYYTALYKEAGQINGKSQSMELYADSIKGEWKEIDGEKYFVFSNACFLGLQALGEKVEPCFEGSAFFSKYEDLINKINQPNPENVIKGEYTVENQENVITESTLVEEVIENTKVTTVEEEEGSENFTQEKTEVAEVENTQEESGAENFSQGEENSENLEIENFKLKISELEGNISTLTIERDNLFFALKEQTTANEGLALEIASLKEENQKLLSYKKDVEDKEKLAIIDEYVDKLSEETIESYKSNLDKYSKETLDKDLFYEMKKANPNIFEKRNTETSSYIPTNLVEEKSGLELILENYKKSKNK